MPIGKVAKEETFLIFVRSTYHPFDMNPFFAEGKIETRVIFMTIVFAIIIMSMIRIIKIIIITKNIIIIIIIMKMIITDRVSTRM